MVHRIFIAMFMLGAVHLANDIYGVMRALRDIDNAKHIYNIPQNPNI